MPENVFGTPPLELAGDTSRLPQFSPLVPGAQAFEEELGLWTQPGVFSWNRIDPGSALLMDHLPDLSGRGADLGAGLGVLAHGVLASEKVTELTLVELDARAVACARRNVTDPRVQFLQADVRKLNVPTLKNLDFIVMNPPFHDGGAEDKSLGQAFLKTAAALLKKGGRLFCVANRHLPYESVLNEHFRRVQLIAEQDGFKVYEALA